MRRLTREERIEGLKSDLEFMLRRGDLTREQFNNIKGVDYVPRFRVYLIAYKDMVLEGETSLEVRGELRRYIKEWD